MRRDRSISVSLRLASATLGDLVSERTKRSLSFILQKSRNSSRADKYPKVTLSVCNYSKPSGLQLLLRWTQWHQRGFMCYAAAIDVCKTTTFLSALQSQESHIVEKWSDSPISTQEEKSNKKMQVHYYTINTFLIGSYWRVLVNKYF